MLASISKSLENHRETLINDLIENVYHSQLLNEEPSNVGKQTEAESELSNQMNELLMKKLMIFQQARKYREFLLKKIKEQELLRKDVSLLHAKLKGLKKDN